MRVFQQSSTLLAGTLLMLAASVAAQTAPPIFDRSPYLNRDSPTSDDVRRVPEPAGYNAPEGTMVLVGGLVFDGTGSPRHAATLVIEGKRIAAILKPGQTNWPLTAKVIDVSGKTVMPGMIDLHVHLTYVERFGEPPEWTSENESDATLRAINRMRIFATSGITSVRDVASHGSVPFVLKRWQSEGRIEGPRIFPAGQLITGLGGHGTEGFALPTAPGHAVAPIREASGPDGWREAVRIQFKQGADVIKLASHYTQDEINAAVQEAHALGLPVAVDAETQYIDMAIQAGVDTIEHPLPRSDAAIQLMAKKGIASVPTLVPYRYIMRNLGGYFGSTSRRFTLNEETIFVMLRKMDKAGVKLGVGTDMVVDWNKYFPYAYIDELKSLTMIGYSNSRALVTATRTNAELLRMDDRLGTLEVGKLADITVISGDPVNNLDDLAKVDRVIVNGRTIVQDGRIFVAPRVPTPPPAVSAPGSKPAGSKLTDMPESEK